MMTTGDFVTACSFQRAAFLIDNAWHAPLMFVGEHQFGRISWML
jgi:hypothetical protein